jgi:hypothetical protein
MHQQRPDVHGAEGAKAGTLMSGISSPEARTTGVRGGGMETLDAFLQRPLDEFVTEAAGPDAGEKGAAILSEKQAEHLVRGIDPDERDEKCSVMSRSALPEMCGCRVYHCVCACVCVHADTAQARYVYG